MYVERDHLKRYIKNVLIQLTVFNKDRHTAKTKTLRKNQTYKNNEKNTNISIYIIKVQI